MGWFRSNKAFPGAEELLASLLKLSRRMDALEEDMDATRDRLNKRVQRLNVREQDIERREAALESESPGEPEGEASSPQNGGRPPSPRQQQNQQKTLPRKAGANQRVTITEGNEGGSNRAS